MEQIFKLCVLLSGSSGNSVYIKAGSTSFLVDAGTSSRNLEVLLRKIQVEPSEISGIIITHEHMDHVSGAGIFSRRWKVPLYMTRETYLAARKVIQEPFRLVFFETGTSFCLGDAKIKPFYIDHDAADPVGLKIEYMDKRAGIATDLGRAGKLTVEELSSCHAVILESNYDDDMLMNSSYPWELKTRIKGVKGHLSNRESAGLIRKLLWPGLRHIFLAHISEENNTRAHVLDEITKVIPENYRKTTSIILTYPDRPCEPVEI